LTDAASIAWWGLVWTVLAGGIFAVAQAVARGIGNAAARHLVWLAAFAAVWFFPAFAAATLAAQRQATKDCVAPTFVAVTLGVANVPPLLPGTMQAAWVAGFVFTLARATLAWRSANRLYSRSRCLLDALVSPHLPGFARHVDLRLASGEDPAVPITWGVRRPVVLLPASASEWDSSLREAAILHELAHVHRLDNLSQLFALFTCAVHWFNPLVWHAARRMEADAEIAADDFAILCGVRPSTYAQQLLRLTTQLAYIGPSRDFARTAMVKASSELEHRLLTIIDPNTSRGPIRAGSLIAVSALLLGAAVTAALVSPRVAVALRPEPSAPCLATSPS
jgi:beta-lactamase regulating signal transducer with metallopeptidase domain